MASRGHTFNGKTSMNTCMLGKLSSRYIFGVKANLQIKITETYRYRYNLNALESSICW